MDDHELLREYVRNRSQEAFRELVDRHLGMAYSAACRMVRDPHLAQEVVQNAFATLARKANSVGPPQTVAGWLYNTTRHFAMHAVRAEQRRRERELTAVAMQALEQNADSGRITEHLEAAMEHLESGDRDALVLRFLENRSLREVGAQLGISEDAARMRVNRALERLRGAFGKEGLAVTSVLLAATLSSNVVTAIPAGLGAAVASTALAGTAATTLAQGAFTTMNWFNLKSAAAIVGAAILTGTGTYFVQQRQIDNLSVTHQNLIAAQQMLTADREAALTAARLHDDELERLRKEAAEVHRLRNEVSQLRQQRAALADLEAVNQKLRYQLAPVLKPPVNQPTDGNAGAYIRKDQLAFVGYATPEASLQSMTWAMMAGKYEMANAALNPEMQASELKDPKARESFETAQQMFATKLKGIQFLAKKVLADDKVELKVNLDIDPGTKPFHIQPMVKVGNEWKLGGSTREYSPSWEQNGQIQELTP